MCPHVKENMTLFDKFEYDGDSVPLCLKRNLTETHIQRQKHIVDWLTRNFLKLVEQHRAQDDHLTNFGITFGEFAMFMIRHNRPT